MRVDGNASFKIVISVGTTDEPVVINELKAKQYGTIRFLYQLDGLELAIANDVSQGGYGTTTEGGGQNEN